MGRPLASSRPVVRPTVLRPQTTSISVVLPATGKEPADICRVLDRRLIVTLLVQNT